MGYIEKFRQEKEQMKILEGKIKVYRTRRVS